MDLELGSKVWDLCGRTIVVTGGAGMLGRKISCALVVSGANVVVLAREPSKTSFLEERMGAGPGVGEILRADVLDKESLLAARERILEKFGAVYGLINLVGGNVPEVTTSPERGFFDLPGEALRYALDLNLLGA